MVRHTAREEIEADRGRQLRKEFLDGVEERGPGIFLLQIDFCVQNITSKFSLTLSDY